MNIQPNEYKLAEQRMRIPKNLHITYKGPFEKYIFAFLREYIEAAAGEGTNAGKKLLKIFIELAQNVSYYSAETGSFIDNQTVGAGIILIDEHDTFFNIVTGNRVKNEWTAMLLKKCKKINELDHEGLRQFKRHMRRLPTTHGGGNIGLIQMALTSDNPLEFNIIPINQEVSYFTVAVRVDK